jgi:hypothetical protein
LGTGTYNVAVRRVGTTCTPANLGSNFVVSVPTPVYGAFYSKTDPTVCGGSDGSVTITVSGGTGQYQYKVNGGAYNGTNLTPSGGHLTISSLTANTYSIVVKDSAGCVMVNAAYISASLSSPTSPGFSVKSYTLPTCYGGNATITLTATGGTSPYRFSSDGSTYVYAPSSGSTITYSVATYTTPAKTYWVKDVHNCTQTVSITGGGTVAAMTATLTVTGGSSLTISASNGTSPYQISLYNATTLLSTVSGVSSFPYYLGTYTGGTFHAVVNDHNGIGTICSATSNTVTITPSYIGYYFRYNLNGSSGSNPYYSSNILNMANAANTYLDAATYSISYTIQDVINYYVGNLSTYGGGSISLGSSTGGWSANTFTVDYSAVTYSSNMALLIPNVSLYPPLNSGNHVMVTTPPSYAPTTYRNAAYSYIGAVTIGGISYSLYDILFTSSPTAAGNSVRLTINN